MHECIDQFGSLIWSIARRLTRTRADAEDAVQEIFTDVWRSAGRFDPNQGSEKVFVATIARRRLIDRMRRAAHQARTESTDDIDSLGFADQGNSAEVCAEASAAAKRGDAITAGTKAGAGAWNPARVESFGNCRCAENATRYSQDHDASRTDSGA